MKKKTALILAIVLVVLAAGGIFAWTKMTSAEYALNGIVKELNESGLKALEPHLTGGARSAYEAVTSVTGNPIVQALASTGLGEKATNALSGQKLTWKLKDIKHGKNTASVTLTVSSGDGKFEEDVDIDMVKENGKWMISDLSIPVTDWIF